MSGFGIGIRKRNPDFADGIFRENISKQFHVEPEKGDIAEPFIERDPGPLPEPVPLSFDADEIPFGKSSRKLDGILSFSAGQFQGDGIQVPEEIGRAKQSRTLEAREYIAEIFEIGESFQMIAGHNCAISCF
jgi:hypothetical protein